jgi:hypothetical protein
MPLNPSRETMLALASGIPFSGKQGPGLKANPAAALLRSINATPPSNCTPAPSKYNPPGQDSGTDCQRSKFSLRRP